MAEISPSILAADFAALGEQIRQAESGGARMLHVDVMDGHFVPNISIGIPVVESLAQTTDLVLDCHLMVANPENYTKAFIDAGAKMVTVHQEACPHLGRLLGRIRDDGAAAGVALNPATPLSTLDEVLSEVDLVLIMSVHPGFGGQSFLPASLDKVRRLSALRSQAGQEFRIQVDGGVNLDNAGPLAEAGCDILVAGSSVFGADDIGEAVRALSARANMPALASA
ncbi:MAG: ribulose-phosphate 3-epimerase [Bryobacterales bacterium]|nr:ribulose-phosphate 3-epimerase [Bryobacterales bacterium]MDE0622573.1 ribulose-phosphate 3-epimerase [Bryobacterales bacterium]